jgi:hypothetical protein
VPRKDCEIKTIITFLKCFIYFNNFGGGGGGSGLHDCTAGTLLLKATPPIHFALIILEMGNL